MDGQTADLITGLVNTREAMVMMLTQWSDAQEARDEE